MTDIKDRFIAIQEKIEKAAALCKRSSSRINLLCVSKYASVSQVEHAYSLGARHFAESRVLDALEKKAILPPDIQWHFIGRIQSNKINKLIGAFALIHSIESSRTAKMLSQKCVEQNCIQPVLLQVNLSGEETKQGFSRNELLQEWEELASLKGIRIDGLMTMAPHLAEERAIRTCFSQVRALKDLLNTKGAHMTELSMGMSGDYEIAIAEGSTLVRIGSALFG